MSFSFLGRFSFFVLGTVALPLALMAQDGQKDANSLLPDIDPQDIEIRGDYKATFPGLRRQPILGFNPRPRVFRIDPDRMPFMETNEQVVASIPISELQKTLAPTWDIRQNPKRQKLWTEGGYGMFQNGYGLLFADIPLSQTLQLITRGQFDSNGQFADTLTNTRRMAAGELSLIHRPDAFKKRRYFVGGSNAFQNTFNQPDAASSFEALRTDFQQVWGGFSFGSYLNAFQHYDLELKAQYTDIQTNAAFPMIELAGHYRHRVAGERSMTAWEWDLAGQYQSQNFESFVGQAGLNYLIRSGFTSRLTLGGRVFASRDELRDKTVINAFPTLNYELWMYQPFSISAYVEGEVRQNGSQTFTENPRLNPLFANQLPVERNLTVGSNARYRFGQSKELYSGFFFRFHQTLNIFDGNFGFIPNGVVPVADQRALALVQAEGAQMFRFKLGFKGDLLAEKLRYDISGWLLNAKLADGQDIPFMERFGVQTELSGQAGAKFSYYVSGRALLQRSGDFTTGNLFLVDLRTDYALSSNFGLFVAGYNLLNQEYAFWSVFQEPPLRILGGLSIKL